MMQLEATTLRNDSACADRVVVYTRSHVDNQFRDDVTYVYCDQDTTSVYVNSSEIRVNFTTDEQINDVGFTLILCELASSSSVF